MLNYDKLSRSNEEANSLSKEDVIEIEGIVREAMPNAIFKVEMLSEDKNTGKLTPSGHILAQHFHLKDGVGHGFTHDAFNFDDVFFRQANCLLIGSAQFVVLGRTGGDESHILLLLRHKIRKVGRKSLSTEKASGCHGHL